MRVLVALVVIAIAPLQACDDDGEDSPCGDSDATLRCVGNQVMSCNCTRPTGTDLAGGPLCDASGLTWQRAELCKVACDVDISPFLGCIASTTPVPECDGVDVTCWNGDRHPCSQGYPLETVPCAETEKGAQCTMIPDCSAICLPECAGH